ncbi:MAG: VPLPA-CTERM sorting domain-containing protein, partial [Paracoccus sp. (in: a-proteobacteria)]
STFALTNATLPFGLRLAGLGLEEAVRATPGLRPGVNVYRGAVTYEAVADSLGLTTYNDDGSVDDEGSITLGFGTTFPTQQDVSVWEVTYNISPTSRHREAVDVYAIMGGVETLLGRLTNLNGGGKVLAGMGFEYIKLVDATLNEFGRSGTTSFDGFDVDSVSVAPVPLPAAGLMLLAGLGGFGVMRRRQKKA